SSFDGCRHKTRNITVFVEAGDIAAYLDLSHSKHLNATQSFSEHRLQLAKPLRLCHYLWSRHVRAVIPGQVFDSREKVIECPFLHQPVDGQVNFVNKLLRHADAIEESLWSKISVTVRGQREEPQRIIRLARVTETRGGLF